MSQLSFHRQRQVLCRVQNKNQSYKWSVGFTKKSAPIVDPESGMVVNLATVEQWMSHVEDLIHGQGVDFVSEKELLNFLSEKIEHQIDFAGLGKQLSISEVSLIDAFAWRWLLETGKLSVEISGQVYLSQGQGDLFDVVLVLAVLDIDPFLLRRAGVGLLQLQSGLSSLPETDSQLQIFKDEILKQLDSVLFSEEEFYRLQSIKMKKPLSGHSQILFF